MLRGNLERCLLNRLRYQADLARHPEILEVEIRQPIIVRGSGEKPPYMVAPPRYRH